MFGGELTVESSPGVGSTFSFVIPMEKGDHATPDDKEPDNLLENGALSSHARILVAEDNAINQKLIVRLLEKMGHSVVIVGNGARAVQKAQEETFDLVLMDIQMPVMGGEEAFRMLRSNEQTSSVPIVALTAHALPEHQQRLKELGMDGYLSKPLDRKKLAETIDDILADAGGAP